MEKVGDRDKNRYAQDLVNGIRSSQLAMAAWTSLTRAGAIPTTGCSPREISACGRSNRRPDSPNKFGGRGLIAHRRAKKSVGLALLACLWCCRAWRAYLWGVGCSRVGRCSPCDPYGPSPLLAACGRGTVAASDGAGQLQQGQRPPAEPVTLHLLATCCSD